MTSKKGWYTPNDVAPRRIVPEYRSAGGGVVDDALTDHATALRQAIAYLHSHKDTCCKMIREYQRQLAKENDDARCNQNNFGD